MPIAMFDNVKEFAKFNSKLHLFSYSEPYYICSSDIDNPVYVNMITGCDEQFKKRVTQFGGVNLGDNANDLDKKNKMSLGQ